MGAGCSSDKVDAVNQNSRTDHYTDVRNTRIQETPLNRNVTDSVAVQEQGKETFSGNKSTKIDTKPKAQQNNMYKSYNVDKNDESGPEMKWREVLNQVADKDLWDGVKREQRPEWQNYLTKADAMARKPRKPISQNILNAVLEGNFSMDLHELPSAQPKVGVFVSSTFTDTKAERNILMRDVYPFVRVLCRRLGIDFGTVDMRWGVTEEATLDHSTVAMCVKEIQKCIKNSVGPAFVCLLSHKYGYRPLPASIDKSEFDKMLSYLDSKQEDTSLIKNYYCLDKNAVPAEYVLKPRTKEDTQWWDNSQIMQEQMRKAAVACFGEDKSITDKYFLSVTETEIANGVFNNPKFESQAYFIQRDLKNVLSDFHLDRKLVDMDEGKVDDYAQEKLKELKYEKVKRIAPEDIVLEVGYDTAKSKQVAAEIKNVSDIVCKELIERILSYYDENLHIEVDMTFQEVIQHRELALDKSSLFIGRENEIKCISDYLRSDNTEPLVVYGRSGCGKTALMAVTAKRSNITLPNSLLVLRFLGTTGQSGSARSLLLSICTQISRLYGKDLSKIPDSYKELIKYFRTCMSFATENRPLVIYLDSLDQLSNEDFAHNLAWLSLNDELPPHVKLIVSSLPTGILDILKRSVPVNNMVEVKQLDMKEGPAIFDKMLSLDKRKVTDEQRNVILKAFSTCPLPLFLRLSADIALRWHSYDEVSHEDIAVDMPGLITKLFERLESRYGEMFVHHALSYITVAKYGLSLAELEDILSCDDEVLDSIFEWWVPPFRRIPPLLWARVRNELGIYLAERGTDGISAYGWYHRQFWETARDRYLNKTFGNNKEPFLEKAHLALADYFDGRWEAGKLYPDPDNPNPKKKDLKQKIEDRQLPKQSLIVSGDRETGRKLNKRKLNELPYHLIKLKDWDRFLKLVFNLEYVEVKFEAGIGYDCLSELIEATRMSGNNTIKLLTRFVGSNLAFLLHEPFAVYQVTLELPPSHVLRKLLAEVTEYPYPLMKNLKEEEFDDPCEMTLQGHTETLRCCDYSPKGDLISSTADDGTLRVWDTITGAELVTVTSLPLPVWPEKHETIQLMLHPVNPSCFSRTGDVIANGTEHGEVMLLDVSGVQLKEVKTGNNAVTYIGFSPDNKHIATSFKNGNVMIWQADDLSHVTTATLQMETTCLHYSPDGKRLAVASLAGLVILETGGYSVEWFGQKGGLCLCCTFHPTRNQVMTGGDDSCVTVWNVEHRQLSERMRQHTAWIWCIKFTKEGDFMFTCSSDRSMKVWRDNGGGSWNVIATVGGHSHRVSMAAIQPGKEEKMVTSSLDRSLKVWDVSLLKQGKVPPVGGMHFNICTAYRRQNYVVTSQGWNKTCRIIADNSVLGNTTGHGGFIKKAEFSPDGTKLFTLDTGHSGGYEAGSERRAQVKVTSLPNCSSLSDGLSVSAPTSMAVGSNSLAVGTSSGEIALFDIETLQRVKTWQTTGFITHMAHSRTSGLIVTCSEGSARIWNSRYDEIKVISDLDSPVTVCTISPDGKYLTIGVDSGKIYIWKLSGDSVDRMMTITTHTAYIKDIEFNETGTRMVTTGDLSLRIWDVEANFKMISAYYAPVNAASFLGDIVLAGEATGNLKYLSI